MPKRKTQPEFQPDYRTRTLSGKPRMNWVHVHLDFGLRLIMLFAHREPRGSPDRRELAAYISRTLKRKLVAA